MVLEITSVEIVIKKNGDKKPTTVSGNLFRLGITTKIGGKDWKCIGQLFSSPKRGARFFIRAEGEGGRVGDSGFPSQETGHAEGFWIRFRQ